MTPKRTPPKDRSTPLQRENPREFAAYVRAMKKIGYELSEVSSYRWQDSITSTMFRAGVAYGRRSKAK